MSEFEGVPHARIDAVRYWEDQAQDALNANEHVMGSDGLGVTGKELEALVWDGLQESIKGGWRTEAEAEETWNLWFKHPHA